MISEKELKKSSTKYKNTLILLIDAHKKIYIVTLWKIAAEA